MLSRRGLMSCLPPKLLLESRASFSLISSRASNIKVRDMLATVSCRPFSKSSPPSSDTTIVEVVSNSTPDVVIIPLQGIWSVNELSYLRNLVLVRECYRVVSCYPRNSLVCHNYRNCKNQSKFNFLTIIGRNRENFFDVVCCRAA